MSKKKLMNCKSCDHEIAKNAKICPNCGAKNKKPFFKKGWFWVIVVFVLIGLAGGSDENETPVQNETKIEESVSTVESKSEEVVEEVVSEETKSEEEVELADTATMGQKNALRSAENYLDFSAFSYEGLIKQLEFEEYSHEDAVYAADNCGADWKEQALRAAKSYLDFSAFSYKGLIKQLEFEGYTTEEATYGADNCGADWKEQAAKAAESYLDFSSFSKSGLIDQLEFEGYTTEEAEYGVAAVGY